MNYVTDVNHNHVVDFSYAGYKGGLVDLPNVPNVDTISPVAGDNTSHIQAALDSIGNLTPDGNGIRGALFLNPGQYDVSGSIYINKSGVVLRGSGRNSDPLSNTILYSTTTSQIDFIILGSNASADSWFDSTSTPHAKIVSEYLPAGTKWIELDDATGYGLGDHVIVFHPCDSLWLESVEYGETDTDADWWPNDDLNITYKRVIAAKSGNFIKLDAPIYHEIDISTSKAYVYEHDDASNILTDIGIEDLRVDNTYTSSTDENHAWNHVCFYGVRDAWAHNLYLTHFAKSGIITRAANNVTIDNVRSRYPRSVVDGGKRYNLNVEKSSNNILFRECEATNGRHSFISNGCARASGIVFTRSESDKDYTSSEGHRWWSHGMLFDSLVFTDLNTSGRVIGLYNRGNYGTSHGWGATNSVLWNVNVQDADILVQEPPIGQNYAFGCTGGTGDVDGNGPFFNRRGYIEGTDSTAAIGSLHRTQLVQRAAFGDLPDAPARLAVADSGTYNYLTWLDIDQAESGYYVERSEDFGISYQVIDTLAASSTSYVDSSFTANSFYYRVRAFDSAQYSPYSNPVNLVLSCSNIELCINGIDDDGDGLLDCEDPDCSEFNEFTEYMAYTPFSNVVGGVGLTATYANIARIDTTYFDLRGEVIQRTGNASGQFEFSGTSGNNAKVLVINDNTNSNGDSIEFLVKWQWMYAGTNTVFTPQIYSFYITDIDGTPRVESVGAFLCDLASYSIDTATNLTPNINNQMIMYTGTENETNGPQSSVRFTYTGLGTFYSVFKHKKASSSQNAGFTLNFTDDDLSTCGMDGGDAPDSYNEADGRTYHRVTSSLYIGDTVDLDLNLIESVDADLDDGSDTDDEDGIVGTPAMINSSTYNISSLSVTNNTTDTAYLAGWMDDDCNGTFDLAERIVHVIPPVGDTSVAFTWSLTYPTLCNQVYLRLRLGTDQSQVTKASGFAKDGEIEDYIVSSGAVLPVSFVSLDAQLIEDDDVLISWVTASEYASDHFIVERSKEGDVWSFVDKVKAAGVSNVLREYSTIDRDPEYGVNYYHLLQYDLDGSFRKYGPVSVELLNENMLTVYPNPTSDFLRVRTDPSRELELTVMNTYGSPVNQSKIEQGSAEIYVGDLPSGMYTIKLCHDGDLVERAQFVKQ